LRRQARTQRLLRCRGDLRHRAPSSTAPVRFSIGHRNAGPRQSAQCSNDTEIRTRSAAPDTPLDLAGHPRHA
jgi:hypothetical protein